MKKIIKKSKYVLAGGLFLVSMLASSKWFELPVEKALADAICIPPEQKFTNGCFTPAEVIVWIDGGGDGGGGGDV